MTGWSGVIGRECGDHRPGIDRSWCHECSEWCWPRPAGGCMGCRLAELGAVVAELRVRMACDARDWNACPRDAWLYGVIVGWDCDRQHGHDEDCNGSLESVAAKWGWGPETVAKLRMHHAVMIQG